VSPLEARRYLPIAARPSLAGSAKRTYPAETLQRAQRGSTALAVTRPREAGGLIELPFIETLRERREQVAGDRCGVGLGLSDCEAGGHAGEHAGGIVEERSGARDRVFDEEAEAKAQGLPYVLVPRELSREEWEKEYCHTPAAEEK
jgi:hypothetical protein